MILYTIISLTESELKSRNCHYLFANNMQWYNRTVQPQSSRKIMYSGLVVRTI
jgi:hypothetical protein